MIRFQDIVIDRSKRTIARNGKTIQFPLCLRPSCIGRCLLFELACALLLGRPMTRTAHFDLLYNGRADGGPSRGPEIIEEMRYMIKLRLADIGIVLHDEGPYGHKRFWAAPIPINRKAGDAIERTEEKALHAQAAE